MNCSSSRVNCCVAAGDQGRWIGIEGAAAADGVNSTHATVPAGTVHRMVAVRTREEARVLGARNAGRGALPTAGKREGISF